MDTMIVGVGLEGGYSVCLINGLSYRLDQLTARLDKLDLGKFRNIIFLGINLSVGIYICLMNISNNTKVQLSLTCMFSSNRIGKED